MFSLYFKNQFISLKNLPTIFWLGSKTTKKNLKDKIQKKISQPRLLHNYEILIARNKRKQKTIRNHSTANYQPRLLHHERGGFVQHTRHLQRVLPLEVLQRLHVPLLVHRRHLPPEPRLPPVAFGEGCQRSG